MSAAVRTEVGGGLITAAVVGAVFLLVDQRRVANDTSRRHEALRNDVEESLRRVLLAALGETAGRVMRAQHELTERIRMSNFDEPSWTNGDLQRLAWDTGILGAFLKPLKSVHDAGVYLATHELNRLALEAMARLGMETEDEGRGDRTFARPPGPLTDLAHAVERAASTLRAEAADAEAMTALRDVVRNAVREGERRRPSHYVAQFCAAWHGQPLQSASELHRAKPLNFEGDATVWYSDPELVLAWIGIAVDHLSVGGNPRFLLPSDPPKTIPMSIAMGGHLLTEPWTDPR